MAYKLGEVYIEVQAKIGQLEKDLDRLTKKVEKDTQKVGDKIGGFADGLGGKIAGLAAGFLSLQGALSFGKKIITAASDFENLRLRLVSLYGDAELASKAFEKFKEVAATTPFSLKGVVEAGAQLKAFGLNAEESIKPITDLAAFMGLDVVGAANAVGRAFAGGAGAADILRERGILNLIKEFKGIDDLTKLTLPQFREALLSTLVDPTAGIMGSTDRMSKSYSGAYSNMQDSIENYAESIGKHLTPALRSIFGTVSMLLTPTKNLSDQFKEQKERVANLNNQIPTLLKKYDELLPLTTDNAVKQGELQVVMNQIAGLLPTAVTEWDRYGNAIGLARDKVIALMEAEKLRLSVVNKNAIEDWEKQRKNLNIEADRIAATLNAGHLPTESTLPFARGQNLFPPEKIPLSSSEITALRAKLEKLNKEIEGVTQQILYLKGEFELPPEVDPTVDSIENFADDSKDILKDYYSEVKFLDSNYYKYRVNLINEEANANEKALGKEFNRAVFINKKKKELADDYFAHINSQLEKFTAQDGTNFFQFDADGQLKGKPSLPLNWKIPRTLEGVETPGKESPFFGTDEDIIGKWLDENEAAAESFNIFVNGMADAFGEMRIRVANDASALTNIFANMANAFIAQVQRMIAQWIAFQMLKVIFNTILPGSGAVASLASPASAALPDGVARLTNPEHVSARNVGTRINNNESILKQLQILNLNSTPKKQEIDLAIDLQGNLAGDDIYLSGKKAEKLRSASRGASY